MVLAKRLPLVTHCARSHTLRAQVATIVGAPLQHAADAVVVLGAVAQRRRQLGSNTPVTALPR